MTSFIFVAVLGAALLHAWWNFLIRSNQDKHLAMIAMTIGHAPIAVLSLMVFGLPPLSSLPYLLISGTLHLGYQVFLMNAYRFGQLSNIYPIARGLSPLLLMLATLIIGLDYISGGQILGIIIISLSMIYIGATQYRFDKDGPKGLLLAVITGCFIASYSLMDAVGARIVGQAMVFFGGATIINVILMSIYSAIFHGDCLRRVAHDGRKMFFLGGAVSYLAYVIVLWACLHAPVAVVSSIRETSVIFAIFLGVLLLGERITFTRIVATIIMLIGVVMTRLF